jgi:PadR family transcriptional regulator PadR
MDTTQLLKGVLDAAVLAVVDTEDGYGYDVVRRLRAGGLEGVGDASVYGTLRRLYASGALTSYVVPSDEGPHRKYYGITPAGRTLLAEQRAAWATFSASVAALLGLREPSRAPDLDLTQPLTQGVSR